jgi:hypothetical protein
MDAGTIKNLGRFTSCLIGGTVPGIKVTSVRDAKTREERIFRSEEAAFDAGLQLVAKLGYHLLATPKPRVKKRAA